MMLGDISTEMLVVLRDRLLSGRTRVAMLVDGSESVGEIERRMIEALESELQRRLH